MQFSLVSTIYNEATRLRQTIADLEAQTIKPAEIIITDAGSRDASWEILKEWQKSSSIPIVLLQEEGCNVARGRNLAIQAAKYELIVSTDFGCRFHPEWLQSLIAPFEKDKTLEVVGGAFSVIEEDLTSLAAKSDYILQNGYPIILDEFFSVSSRSIAYKKEVWEQIGAYPEWLTLAADDTIFWKLVKHYKFSYSFVEQAFVFWGRHKTNKAFAKEGFRYGLGDGESKINYRNFWSNLIETGLRYTLIPLLILMLALISIGSAPWYILFSLILFLPGLRSYINAYKNWLHLKSSKYDFKVFLNALWQLELSRIQYLKGYIKGLSTKDPEKIAGRTELWQTLNKTVQTADE